MRTTKSHLSQLLKVDLMLLQEYSELRLENKNDELHIKDSSLVKITRVSG
jgi:hypothetical protein